MAWRFATAVIDSDIPLMHLPEAGGPSDLTVRVAPVPRTGWTPVQVWHDDAGGLWASIDRHDAGYRVRFPSMLCAISVDGRTITVDPEDGTSTHPATVHLLLHQVLPLALSRRHLVLHACAVQGAGGTIALVGPSGAGKSTLAAAFCARGFALVADDALVIDFEGAPAVWPTADGLRLWEDMALLLDSDAAPIWTGGKHRLRATLAEGRSPLTRLVLIGETSPARATIESLSAANVRVDLLSHLFRLDIGDRDESRRLFDAVDRVVRAVPARRLIFPDGVTHLDAAVDAVIDDLACA